MVWTKIDEGYRSHPKILAAGPDGMALDVAGMTYANQYGTDGFLPAYAIPTLYPVKSSLRVVKRLIEVVRWHDADEKDCKCRADGPPAPGPGCWIHDFLDYNPTAAEVAADKEERSRRGKAGADARWHGSGHGSGHGGTHNGKQGGRQGSRDATGHGGKNAPTRTEPKTNPPSSTSDSRPDDEPVDDEQRVHATLKAITDRRIADHAGPVHRPAAYRNSVAAGVRKDFAGSAYLLAHQHPDWPPERLAVTLDPPDKPKLAVVATENTRLGGISQWLAGGTGA
jgi:hypothetical protein